jgi:hypothetical protein
MGETINKNATHENALDDSQYALPGMRCNSAVWNKVLFLDLMQQTLSTGILTIYDATAAFDWVLHSMSIITCRRLGLPRPAYLFIYNLLHNMEFHIATGFGISEQSFSNNEDPTQTGQCDLQGSSSAAPVYNVNSDVSLMTYNRLLKGQYSSIPLLAI